MNLPDAGGKAKEFLNLYSPNAQRELYVNDHDCLFGDYPTVKDVCGRYGERTAQSWVVIQLHNLSEFCGCKEKISIPALEETSLIIVRKYGYMKVTELMLFFYMFKCGEFGRFYGTVDPILILSSIKDFISWRNDVEYNVRKKEELETYYRNMHDPLAISREEYLRRKAEKDAKNRTEEQLNNNECNNGNDQ